jgi:hypothetical protein
MKLDMAFMKSKGKVVPVLTEHYAMKANESVDV